MSQPPRHIDLKKESGLTVTWKDGSRDFLPIDYLRRMSPSAEAKHLRDEMARNPLTVLPATKASSGPIRAVDAELVGNYAIRIRFSDGHHTGIYSWAYLRQLARSLRSNKESLRRESDHSEAEDDEA